MRARWRWLVLAAFLVVAGVSHPWYLRALGNYLVVNDRIERSDAILVLAGGNSNGGRLAHAVQLLQAGHGRFLMLSGVEIAWQTNSADIMKRQALLLNVPESALILVKHNAHSTLEEAKVLVQAVQSRGFARVTVVTSNFHTRRVKWVYQRLLRNTPIQLFVAVAKDYEFNPSRWWRGVVDAEILFYEYTKLFWYYLFAGI